MATANTNEVEAKKLTSKTKKKDIVSFGPYEWKVLAKTNGRFLLITNEAICKKEFNDVEGDITWKDCSLRKWLNDVFYQEFSDEEKAMIELSDTKTGRYDSQDYVFLLTYDDAIYYFTSDEDRQCRKGFALHGKANWWLRTGYKGIGKPSESIDAIYEDGATNERHWSSSEHDVRPAIWVKLEK